MCFNNCTIIPKAPMIRVMIIDDHPIVRRGLTQSLADYADITIVEEAGDGGTAIEKIKSKKLDVILLDISIPGRGGIDILKEIKRHKPDMPVLMLSMHPEDQYGIRAIKAGACGYINKASDPELLIEAIRRAATGKKFISEALTERLIRDINLDPQSPGHKDLSDREFEVLRLIASGKTVSEVAQLLTLSVKTISTYRMRIMDKMGMKTNAELTHYAIKNQLV